jgi:hypothetical protein
MKQTAVDYIKEKLQGYGFDFGYVLDVAKEMEKEQIVNAYNDCEWTGDHEDGEQYYKETYESNTRI